MEFALAMPPLPVFALTAVGVFCAVVSFVFAASVFQTGYLAKAGTPAEARLRPWGCALSVSGCVALAACLYAFWLHVPWYVAVPLVGLNILFAPPLEGALRGAMPSVKLFAGLVCLADLSVAAAMAALV